MVSAFSPAALHRLELWLAAALIFFLPLFEAPKNIFWGLYLVVWVVNRARSRDFGGPWDIWDTLIAAWIASGFLVAAFAGLDHKEWQGAGDLLRYGSMLWCLKRSRYAPRDLRVLFVALVAGTLAALADGYWRRYVTGVHQALELNSVGHVNHSAIYLAIATGAVMSAALTYWSRLAGFGRTIVVIVLGLFLFSEFVMESRVAVGAVLALTVLIGAIWTRRLRRAGIWVVLVVLAVVVAGMALRAEVFLKQERLIQQDNVMSFRLQIWNTALLAWQQYPLWGIGMSNYEAVKPEVINTWLAKRPDVAKPESYFSSSGHAHNLYVNALAERGMAGVIPLAAILIMWLYTLFLRWPRASDADLTWVLWGGALSAWFITVGVGVFNTTLHHEHALLAVILLGLWLANRKERSAVRGT